MTDTPPVPYPKCKTDKHLVMRASIHGVWIVCKRCKLEGEKAERLQPAVQKWNEAYGKTD